MNTKIKYIFTYIVLAIAIIIFFYYEKEEKIKQHLEEKNFLIQMNYDSLYHEYKKIADLIFQTKINNENILELFSKVSLEENNSSKIRDSLYNSLDETYEILKSYNLQQLHFHTKDNKSFLRFHRPSRFDDDLTKVRKTVDFVNQNQKPIDGFEEGRIFNGYRFVYPLLYKGVHLGSVEISFSTVAFNQEYFYDYHSPIIFLVDKNVVDAKVFQDEKSNYIPSFIPNFYIQKSEKLQYQKFKISENILKNIFQGEIFSIYESVSQHIVTFIPLINPISKKVVATHLVYSDSKFISNKTLNFYFLILSNLLLLALVFYYIYKNHEKNRELRILNTTLKKTNKYLLEDTIRKDEILMLQSKTAAMGEMIDTIAHQWQNPITVIKMYLSGMEYELEKNSIEKSALLKYLEKTDFQIEHLMITVQNFREFFNPNSPTSLVSVKQIIDDSILLMKDELIFHTIKTVVQGEDKKIFVSPNNLKHLFINFFSNSRDAFKENKIKDKTITITIKTDIPSQTKIFIEDNAGGIPNNIIDNIFDFRFTTKEKNGGTGIGLYLCKMILDKIKADVKVYNQNLGVCFEITFYDEN